MQVDCVADWDGIAASPFSPLIPLTVGGLLALSLSRRALVRSLTSECREAIPLCCTFSNTGTERRRIAGISYSRSVRYEWRQDPAASILDTEVHADERLQNSFISFTTHVNEAAAIDSVH